MHPCLGGSQTGRTLLLEGKYNNVWRHSGCERGQRVPLGVWRGSEDTPPHPTQAQDFPIGDSSSPRRQAAEAADQLGWALKDSASFCPFSADSSSSPRATQLNLALFPPSQTLLWVREEKESWVSGSAPLPEKTEVWRQDLIVFSSGGRAGVSPRSSEHRFSQKEPDI